MSLPKDMSSVLVWLPNENSPRTGHFDRTTSQWSVWFEEVGQWKVVREVEEWASFEDARNARHMRADTDHALSQAKARVPDYPWMHNDAKEAVWAVGSSLKVAGLANDELHAAIRKAVTALIGDDLAH